MEGNDFLGEETSNFVQRYEKMLRNRSKDYFEPDAIEMIAEHYLQQEKYKKAEAAIAFGQEIYPQHVGFWIKLAEVYLHTDRYEMALTELEKAVIYEPCNSEIYLLKAEVLLGIEEPENAKICFEKAIQHTDELIDCLFEIGFIYQDHDLFDEAIFYFKEVISIDSRNEQAYYETANCLDLLYCYEESVELLNQLIDIDPYNATAWYNLGVMYTKLNLFKEAIEAFDFCLVIDETYTVAKFNKANALVEMENFDQAILMYQEVIKDEGEDGITLCNLAGCYERKGDYEQSRALYKKASFVNPNLAEAWFGIGLTLFKDGKGKDALQFFKRAVLLETDNIEYLMVLAECEYSLSFKEEAIGTFEKITELDPSFVEAWIDWSFILYKDGDYLTAETLLKTALPYNPTSSACFFRLALVLFKAGRVKESLINFEKALQLNFEEHEYIFELSPELALLPEFIQLVDAYRPQIN
jgi:tetratricopeptide (TPR) repeat protein